MLAGRRRPRRRGQPDERASQAATAARSGAASIAVANRTRAHAERVAESVGTTATTVSGLADLPAALAAADVVISCTGATGQVITLRHGGRPRSRPGQAAD